MTPAVDAAAVARHFLLDGKVAICQSAGGEHRAGLDAVMLAAAVSLDPLARSPRDQGTPRSVLTLVDLGAGVGAAGLCVAARLARTAVGQGLHVTLVENDPQTLALARLSVNDPANAGLAASIDILDADVTLRGAARAAAGLRPDMADWVIMNPPFHDPAKVRLSPNRTRAAAHVLGDDGLLPWFRTAAAIMKKDGRLALIFPAEGLARVLDGLKGRFGGVSVFPLFRGAEEPAIRVIVTATKASRAPLRLLPGLVLHEKAADESGRRDWTAAANAVLKGNASLFI